MTDEEFEELEELYEFMEFYTMKNDMAKMLVINMNFHQMIYTASHNRMLKNLLSSYQEMLKHAESPFADKSDDYLKQVFKEHSAIFEAFRKRDVDAGIAAMTIHMDNSKQRYLEHMK